jgi:hypothetical protein
MQNSFPACLLIAQALLTGSETAFGAAYFRRTFGVPELPIEIGSFPAPGFAKSMAVGIENRVGALTPRPGMRRGV